MYMWDMAIFAVLTALIAISFNYSSMFIFRFVLSVGIGADYAISTTIISEFSPIKSRDRLLAANASSWWIGAAVAYVLAGREKGHRTCKSYQDKVKKNFIC